jgi:hypothetical protein
LRSPVRACRRSSRALKELARVDALAEDVDGTAAFEDAVVRPDPLKAEEAVVAEVDWSEVKNDRAAELKSVLGEVGAGGAGRFCPAAATPSPASCPSPEPVGGLAEAWDCKDAKRACSCA